MIRTFTVTISHTGDMPGAFDKLFAQYLTDWDGPFLSDYGLGDRSDGYAGPFVTSVTVAPATTCPECGAVAVTLAAGPLPVCMACDWTGWPIDT